jgi:thymidylate kinase
MPSIALIGPDGSGKTTVTRMLEASGILPFKYLYMGIEVTKSNVALPTSRLIARLVARSRKPGETGGAPPTEQPPNGRRGLGGRLWAYGRLTDRLLDEWFRQLVSWSYELRGHVVLYDRHFVFDFAPEVTAHADEPLDKRIHRWCLARFYPRPDLVIFLDAPAAVLLARKGESTLAELERRRHAFLSVGARTKAFVRVDATRPLPDVYAEVVQHVLGACARARIHPRMPEVAR